MTGKRKPNLHHGRRRFRVVGATVLAMTLTMPAITSPAHAFFGLGGGPLIVYDPQNHAENILSAARALEQINNQITSLQNEARMLTNQARNLTGLPHSSLQELQQNVARTQELLGEARNIAFDVEEIDQKFRQDYGTLSADAPEAKLIEDARSRWQSSVGGLQDAMRMQAGVVGNLETQQAEMKTLVEESQGAVGALQAAQAGNQLLALQSQQLGDLTAMLAANGRAEALMAAERATAAEQGRIQRGRFLAPSSGYQPGAARMFNQ
ncbi:P-type conjugative transfer protein TrbJ [Paracoccus saliphilus]|uniref:P-type conjugative transfer protein TrbJ n=2 Tax=Paracoccus saliphilus TaxID=405559 RepID=A0AA46A7J9_9RHOB|nr:P-type conjugative transfer protein TrbJ [Paracoccus saliphilus]WCR05518.1 P-type conjugative transfer protein TrbJ [Paracoccus saliphilus]SIT14940.1 P-type conjugative transfer protein TrbJ [Paracoccus saliphilus]